MTTNMTFSSQEFESFVPVYDVVPDDWNDARPFLVEILKKITNGLNARVKIFNAIGELVYQSVNNDVKTIVDITNQANGVYMLQVITADGTSQQRIVKQ